jgi:hypothetical protein
MPSVTTGMYLILPATLWPLGLSQPLREIKTKNLSYAKELLALKAVNLTAICEPIVQTM